MVKRYVQSCIDVDIDQQVTARCRAEGRSKSSLIEFLLKEWLTMKTEPPKIISKDPDIIAWQKAKQEGRLGEWD